MTRKYELKRRAERQEETRRRIVEAAVELHSTVGPARTTLSAVAERAGVQRHTLYRHFPTERDLGLACSGLAISRDPPPDPTAWAAIADPRARLQVGLGELYAYFERNESLLGNVLRDAEVHPLTRELAERRVQRTAAAVDVLAEPLGADPRGRAAVGLAADFGTWRTLVRRNGLAPAEAVELMTRVVLCACA